MTVRPIVPEDFARHAAGQRDLALRSLSRAAIAVGQKALGIPQLRTPGEVLQARGWADDRGANLLTTRAATTPTSIANAAALTTISYALLDVLAPVSAAAALLQHGMQLEFGRSAQILLPTLAPGLCSFIGEAAPIPVQKFASSGPTMSPYKLACICELTAEMMASSNAETLVRAVLAESAARGLDNVLFDQNVGDAVRPPGLRYNVSPLTPAAPGEKQQAMADDIVALGSAISRAIGASEIVYVCAPEQAIALVLRSLGTFKDRVLPSASLPAGEVIAVGVTALAAAIGDAPQIDASQQAEIHRETAPAQIASGGVMVSPVASMFQVDSVALRLTWPLSWTLRASGSVAWMSGVNW